MKCLKNWRYGSDFLTINGWINQERLTPTNPKHGRSLAIPLIEWKSDPGRYALRVSLYFTKFEKIKL